MMDTPLVAFAQTSIDDQMRMTINTACKPRKPVLIVGPPGIGKTTSAMELARCDRSMIYLKAGPRNGRLTVFFNHLVDVLSYSYGGLWLPGKVSQQTRFETLADHLAAKYVRAIMIDESQNLNWDTMRELMDLGEESGTTICFIGNNSVLKRTKATEDAINQLRSRVNGRTLELTRFSADDVTMIAMARNVEGEEAFQMLQSFTMLSPANDLRAVDTLLDAACEIAGHASPIRLIHLRKALKLGFPKQDERDLFKINPKPKREENVA